ncbi:PREDICTED: uncharacterized protein LOC108565584, partial [Nicrophorus vespilloides]|uniref:Uncharacterized protein LOC108565584 n=1 Tax=Nicrophorus vespilloides TaxID=110193 RepID=A0ABM1N1B0_NICVS
MGNNQNQGNTINPEHGSLKSQETTEIMIEIDVNVENVSVLQDFEIINKEDCVEEVVEVGSLENNLNNIPKEGITDRSDLSDVKANLQEDNETFDDPINTEMENLYNIPEEGIADRSDLSVVKADLQEDKETFDDLINTEMENLNNIPEEGIANRSDLYDVKADLQEDNETFDDSINTEMENLNNIPEESIADRSDLYDVKADLQKDNETFDDVINTEMTNLQDVEGMNKEDCAEEGVNVGSLENNENNKPEDDIEVVPVNAFFDNDIIPEMANDDAKAESGTILQECEYTNGPNCEEIDDKGANNIEEEPDIPEEELDIPEEESDIIQEETDIPEVQPDVHNIIDDSQSDNAYLDKSTELQFVDNDGNDERGSHLETCKTLNAKFDDEEEDGARCLEINIPKEVVMDDEECTEILIIRNKILEIFPDVEES